MLLTANVTCNYLIVILQLHSNEFDSTRETKSHTCNARTSCGSDDLLDRVFATQWIEMLMLRYAVNKLTAACKASRDLRDCIYILLVNSRGKHNER